MNKTSVNCPNCSKKQNIDAIESNHKCECGQNFKLRKDLNIERHLP